MYKKIILSIAFLFLSKSIIFSQIVNDIKVSTIEEFNAAIKKAVPGTTIILKNGEWKNVEFTASGVGTEKAPITITAETAGQVIITGDSKLNISGQYIVVSNLWFKDGVPTSKEVISFKKNSKEFANNCRVTNCTISNYNPSDNSTENHWVDMWGKNNRVDHNNFTGKTNVGTTLVVWLKGDEHIENNHQIDHNFFGKRPDLGSNGGETIRIGTSTNSMLSSKTIVENNVFKQCNGEIEIVSNKSCDNIYRNNLFLESEGTLTLRHGNRALVEGNVFLGNNKPKTGGIRVIGEGHIVRNNLLVGLAGDDYRGPIVIMNGVPNSPLNRYFQVKNADIQNNTIINCGAVQFSAGKDNEKSLAPIQSIFANNLITNTNAGTISEMNDAVDGIKFSGNIVDSEASANPLYFKKVSIDWDLLKSLPMPSLNNDELKIASKIGNTPEFDITNNKRTVYVAGAFNLGNKTTPEAITSKAGPSWNPIIEDITPSTVISTIIVEPGIETLSKAIKKASSGSTLLLNPGTYIFEKTVKITGNITIKGSEGADKIIIKSAENLEKSLNYFFRVNEEANLHLENITLDGDTQEFVKYAVVSPDKGMNTKYSLFINNCVLKNFSNKNGGAVFKAYEGTIADTISIKNSIIEESYRGLNLSSEKDPIGKYNAEVIILHNTLFKSIEEYVVNYVKSGLNANIIPGGKLLISNCIFSKIANEEKGVIIKTKGIGDVNIKNSIFESSFTIKTPVSLSGFNSSIENSLVYACGTIKTSKGAKAENVSYKSPKWDDHKLFIPSKKSPLLKENNGIDTIGLLNPLKF